MKGRNSLRFVREHGSENYIRLLTSKNELLKYINFMDGFQFGEEENEWGSVDDFGIIYIILGNKFISLEEGTTRKSFREQFGINITEAIQHASVLYYQDAYDSVVWVHPNFVEEYTNTYGEIIPVEKLTEEEFFEVIWDPYQLPPHLFKEYCDGAHKLGLNAQEMKDKLIREYYYSIHPELLDANPDEIEFRGNKEIN
jgi:hypothetical protein